MNRLRCTLVATALAASILVFIPGQIEQFETPKIALVRACGLALLCSSLSTLNPRRWWPSDAIERVLVLFVIVEIAATITSLDARLSLVGEMRQREGLLTSLALAGFYLGARDGTPQQREIWLKIVLGAGALSAVYALLQATGHDILRWESVSPAGRTAFMRPASTLGHPNHLGVVLAALVGITGSLFWDRPQDRWLTGPLAMLFAVALGVSFSRGGWAGGIAAAGCVLILHAGTIARRRWFWLGWISVSSVIIALVIFTTGWGALIAERAGESFQLHTGSARSRVVIWRSTLQMIIDRPWLGFGPDTFELVFPRFETSDYWQLEWNFKPLHPHNFILHVLATRGILGGLLLVSLAVICLRRILRDTPTRIETRARAWLAALGGVLTAGMFGTPSITGMLIMLLALAHLSSPRARSATRVRANIGHDGVWRSGLAILVFVAVLIGAGWQYTAAHQSYIAMNMRGHDPVSAVAHSRAGAHLAPWDEHLQRAHVETLLFAMNTENRQEWCDEAAAAGTRLVSMGPRRAVNYQRLAMVELARALAGEVGADSAMAAAFDIAAELAPSNPIFRTERARALRALGRLDEAIAILQPALDVHPDQGRLWVEMAEIELAKGDRAAALACMRKAVAGRWPVNLQGWVRAMGRLKEMEGGA